MNILHITSHLGGGLGTVIMGWMDKKILHYHIIATLDTLNSKAAAWMWAGNSHHPHRIYSKMRNYPQTINKLIIESDIVVVHWYDHPMLAELFSRSLPACRLIFWCHKNYLVPQKELDFPDFFIDTSPIQGHGKYIWSIGNIDRFFAIQPKKHKGFNVGYIGTVDFKKIHPEFLDICKAVRVPDVHFTIVGENNIGEVSDDKFTFTGKVDDVVPYLAEMDVLFYILRKGHYGTCEQVLGESMAAGIVPITMDNSAEKIIIDNGKTGLIAKNEREAIEYVSFLYKNPSNRKKMANNARKSARNIYDINKMIKQWEQIFKKIITQPKKKRGTI